MLILTFNCLNKIYSFTQGDALSQFGITSLEPFNSSKFFGQKFKRSWGHSCGIEEYVVVCDGSLMQESVVKRMLLPLLIGIVKSSPFPAHRPRTSNIGSFFN